MWIVKPAKLGSLHCKLSKVSPQCQYPRPLIDQANASFLLFGWLVMSLILKHFLLLIHLSHDLVFELIEVRLFYLLPQSIQVLECLGVHFQDDSSREIFLFLLISIA